MGVQMQMAAAASLAIAKWDRNITHHAGQNSRARLASPTSGESCRPPAITRRNVLLWAAVGAACDSCAPGSTIPLPHPASQRLVVDLDPMFLFQMLSGQRRSESLSRPSAVVLSLTSCKAFSRIPSGLVCRDRRPALPCTKSSAPTARYRFTSRLVCRQLVPGHLRGFDLLQFPLSDPLQYPCSPHLFCTHPCPSHQASSAQFQGTFLSSSNGDIITESQKVLRTEKNPEDPKQIMGFSERASQY